VEKVLDILDAELALVMKQMGTPALKDIEPTSKGRYGCKSPGLNCGGTKT